MHSCAARHSSKVCGVWRCDGGCRPLQVCPLGGSGCAHTPPTTTSSCAGLPCSLSPLWPLCVRLLMLPQCRRPHDLSLSHCHCACVCVCVRFPCDKPGGVWLCEGVPCTTTRHQGCYSCFQTPVQAAGVNCRGRLWLHTGRQLTLVSLLPSLCLLPHVCRAPVVAVVGGPLWAAATSCACVEDSR